MTQKLDNYLRTHRRRAGFTQDEVAFLLGTRNGSRVGRYERADRMPLARTIFAYEVIFGASARELFAGIYADIERDTSRRAVLLAKQLASASTDARTARKIESLQAIYVPVSEITTADHDEAT